MPNPNYEVIIIGGSYAGLSAALALGRARRKVLVIDAGEPCNRFTPHAQNFLTRDGTPPAELRRLARADVERYLTVTFRDGRVIRLEGEQDDFRVTLGTDDSVNARRIIAATGVIDLLTDIPGLAECWGTSVIHCPYCHGYEFADQPTGFLSNGPAVEFFPKKLLNWTSDLKIFTNGPANFAKAELVKLGVLTEEREVAELRHDGGYLREVVFTDGGTTSLTAMYYHPPFRLGSEYIVGFAPDLSDTGHIQIDEEKRTSVPGVFAVGDCTTMFRSVAMAVAAGSVAGAMANHDLIG